VKRNGHGLFKGNILVSAWGKEEKYKNPHLGVLASMPRSEPATPQT
jgi:hypothetical protein